MENLLIVLRNQLLNAAGYREFTESDWIGYAGCERFANGSQPIIKEDANDVTYVLDASGLCRMYYNEADEAEFDALSINEVSL